MAAHLVCVQHPDRAVNLLLDRLEHAWVPGVQHLFTALKTIRPPFTDRLQNVLNKGLTANSESVAEAAAALASDLVARGVIDDPGLIKRAFAHWQANEQPSPSHGIIPRSPRETLLGTLFALQRGASRLAP